LSFSSPCTLVFTSISISVCALWLPLPLHLSSFPSWYFPSARSV
jgi:hypothetical protein